MKGIAIDPAMTTDASHLTAIMDAAVVIGRSTAATLRLLDPTISRKHATIARVAHGFAVEDHDSRFGTFVNGARVRSATLQAGDRVRFGSILTYRVEPGGLRLDERAGGMTLAAENLAISTHREYGSRPLLADITLQIPADSFTGILGPSGAGKSTLLNCLAGSLVPEGGQLCFDGHQNAVAERPAYQAMLGLVSQDDVVFRSLTVRENLADAARLRLGREPQAGSHDAAIDRVLERVALVEHAEKTAAVLSGGQRKRLSVAIELLRRPRLLLLDEPTSGLDPASEAHLMEQLRHVASRGTTVVCTTHLMDNLRLLDTVIVLGVVAGVGRLAYSGPPDGLLLHFRCRGFADLYELLAAGRFEPLSARPDSFRLGSDAPRGTQVGSVAADTGSDRFGRDTGGPATLRRSGVGSFAVSPAAATALRQLAVVGRRAIRLTLRDRGLAQAMVAQPVVLGLLVAVAQYDTTDSFSILFFAVVVTLWLGLNNSARDLVSERRHYIRDRLAGLNPVVYLGAKSLVHAWFGLGQILILLVVLRISCGVILDPHSEILGQFSSPGLLVVLMLTYFGGVGSGLLVSTLVRTEEAAVAALPLLIMPQMLISAVAAGVQHDSYLTSRPFRPLVVTLTSRQVMTTPATLVDGLSLVCFSRPATLVAASPTVGTYGHWIWLGDLCHLLILLLGIWMLVFLTFGRAEPRWLRSYGL